MRAAQQMAVAIRANDWAALSELNYRSEHPPLAKLTYGIAIAGLPLANEIPNRPTKASPAANLPKYNPVCFRVIWHAGSIAVGIT